MTISHVDTYYFTITKNGEYNVIYGYRNHMFLERLNYMKINSLKVKKTLNKDELDTIIKLSNMLDEKNYKTIQHGVVLDAFVLEIWYNNKIYSMVFGEHKSDSLYEDLVNEILKLSPIDVKLHGIDSLIYPYG